MLLEFKKASLIDFRGKAKDDIKCIAKPLRYFWICLYSAMTRVAEGPEAALIPCPQRGGYRWEAGWESGQSGAQGDLGSSSWSTILRQILKIYSNLRNHLTLRFHSL